MRKELNCGLDVQRTSYGLSGIDRVVERYLMPYWREGLIYAFSGEIGAGKTTMLKVLLKHAGVVEEVVSPTYAYFCRYQAADGLSVYHFDLYRVDSIETFCEMEFDIILKDAKNVIVLEWPGVIKDVLTERAFADRVVWVDLRYGLSASTERIFELHSSAKNEINSAI
jgi:tRNA threonylcarbamoyl adenosine modification protein YjeE